MDGWIFRPAKANRGATLMLDSDWPHFRRPKAFSGGGAREGVPAFVSRRSGFFVLLAVLLAQLLFLSLQITRGKNVRLIQVWAVAVFSPFERGVHAGMMTMANSWESLSSLWGAEAENHVLKSELSASKIQIQQLSEQAAETDRLRGLLDFKTHLSFASVAADVIADAPDESPLTILINRGSDAGIEKDQPVITPEGVVGKVVAVYAHTAEVLLITDSSSGLGAMIAPSQIQGVLKGAGLDQCRMQYVMDHEKVAAGQAVLTSGLDQVYPKGLKVGTIIRVDDGNIYKNIEVRPAAALDRLETVLVLQKYVTARQGSGAGLSP